MKKIINLFRKDLLDFKPYKTTATLQQISQQTGIPVKQITKLDTGENPYLENLQPKKILLDVPLYIYPDPLATDLRLALSSYTKLKPEMIACFNGSDEAIDVLIRLFIGPGDELIISPPTFPMYEFYGKLAGGKVQAVLRNPNLSLDLKNIIKTVNPKTKMIFIDSPGNPTGTLTPINVIEQLLKQDVILLVDEAYFEYCGQTAQPLLKRYPNLVIIRTLSKWAGLAGLRVGYVLADPLIINKLFAIKSPYNLNSASQAIATEVLKNSGKFLTELKKMTILRQSLVQQLSKFSKLKVFPTSGAYIVVQPKENAGVLVEFLKFKGILLRAISQPLVENCIRINICRKKEIEILIDALKAFYKE